MVAGEGVCLVFVEGGKEGEKRGRREVSESSMNDGVESIKAVAESSFRANDSNPSQSASLRRKKASRASRFRRPRTRDGAQTPKSKSSRPLAEDERPQIEDPATLIGAQQQQILKPSLAPSPRLAAVSAIYSSRPSSCSSIRQHYQPLPLLPRVAGKD